MKKKKFNTLLNLYFNGYSYMCKKYPKAARKRRIRKKWKNRFGPGLESLFQQKTTDLILFGRATITQEEINIWHQSNIIKFP